MSCKTCDYFSRNKCWLDKNKPVEKLDDESCFMDTAEPCNDSRGCGCPRCTDLYGD